jgi:hypothetical protein
MVDNTKPYLVVATPCYGGQVSVKYLTSALALQRAADQRWVKIDFTDLSNAVLITHARNKLASTTLADLFTPLLSAGLSFAVRTSLRSWLNDEIDDGLAAGRLG